MNGFNSNPIEIEVFFDGDCPLCLREIGVLRRWDGKKRIRFTDIAGTSFRTAEPDLDWNQLMAQMHGRLPSGELISGVEVFRRMYSAVGLGKLVWISRLPGLSWFLELGYRLFARHRLWLTGRCADGNCRIGENSLPIQQLETIKDSGKIG